MKLINNKWINVDFQARIEPPPIPLIKAKNRNTEETDIIKIKMRQYPASTTSETYKLKVQTFEKLKLEEFLQMMKDFKTGIDGTATISATGKINFYAQWYAGGPWENLTSSQVRLEARTIPILKKSRRVYLVTPPPKRAKQAETRHVACYEKNLRYSAQDICSTTNGIEQLPSAFPRIEKCQEYGPWRTKWDPTTCCP